MKPWTDKRVLHAFRRTLRAVPDGTLAIRYGKRGKWLFCLSKLKNSQMTFVQVLELVNETPVQSDLAKTLASSFPDEATAEKFLTALYTENQIRNCSKK